VQKRAQVARYKSRIAERASPTVLHLKAFYTVLGISMSVEQVLDLAKKHERWRQNECLNLIPSENITSPTVRQLMISDMGHRYTSQDRYYAGTRYIDEMEMLGETLAKEVFKAEAANLRPISGHMSDIILISTFAKPMEKVMTVHPLNGGYPGLSEEGLLRVLGLQGVYFPFDRQRMNIKVDESADLIKKVKPRIVVFGASFFLFPHPVRELMEVCRDNGILVAYDGSHVLGLVAGGEFQNPFKDGVDILVGSTHKSFFGPQGGIILAKREYGEQIAANVHPMLVDNAHWNRIAALTMALAEVKEFGRAYARQVVKNAKALAKSLDHSGLSVVGKEYGLTKSHQVILDAGGSKAGRDVARSLEKANMITDCGVRLGTCEVTRLGMKESEMKEIAEFIARILLKNEKPQDVKRDVVKFRTQFEKIQFCFD